MTLLDYSNLRSIIATKHIGVLSPKFDNYCCGEKNEESIGEMLFGPHLSFVGAPTLYFLAMLSKEF